MDNEKRVTEEEFFKKIKSLSHSKNCNRLAARYSYAYLSERGLLQSQRVIDEVRNTVSSTKPYKVKIEAYKTCQKLKIECDMPIHNFEVDPEEIKILKPVFIYMKQKKWLQPYNAPKFRMAFGIVNSLEFKKRIKNMSEKKRK